ncbi:hypothetical protein [Miltoncostaea oceani]|uniref:hypothetical protein n=1 Tax=Miltoncostaea oceani TaxID=2843216 RepID=UPI001C3C6953|nr:hypothetical protein [Miltoncostaea oceani]
MSEPGPLEAAVAREIAWVSQRSEGAEGSWPAQLAVRLAREIEAADATLSARVQAGKLLHSTLDRLRQAAPSEKRTDRVDELLSRRKAREATA